MPVKTGMYASLEEPKPLDKELTEKEHNFVVNLVDNNLPPVEAFHASGYTAEKSNASNRAKRLQRHLFRHIEKRISERVGETSILALSVLESLMRTADSENVKLNAANDAVHKQETTIKEVTELTDDELDEQIALLSNVVKLDVTPRD